MDEDSLDYVEAVLNPRFRAIRDTRDPEKVLCDGETVVWAALAGLFLRKASRNRMDCDRNEGRLAESVLRLGKRTSNDASGAAKPRRAHHLESLIFAACCGQQGAGLI